MGDKTESVNVRVGLREVFYRPACSAPLERATVVRLWQGMGEVPGLDLRIAGDGRRETRTVRMVPHVSSVPGASEGYWCITRHGDEGPLDEGTGDAQ